MYICGVKQDENSSVVVTPNREELSWEELSRRDAKEPLASKMAFVSLPGGFHFCAFWWHLDFHHIRRIQQIWLLKKTKGAMTLALSTTTQPLPHTPNTTMLNEAAPLQSSQPFVLQSYWVTILIIFTCLLQATKQKLLLELGYKSRLSMFLRCKICILEAKEEIQIMSVEAILSFRILGY